MPRLALPPSSPWLRPLFWAELFAISNIAFLAVDIAMAHAVNAFAEPAEWVPIYFSIAGTLALFLALALGGPLPPPAGGGRPVARVLGLAVGWGAVAVGVTGLVLHLRGSFFAEQTLRNLVYTAPFVAPLAYTGVGLLLLLNRLAPTDDARWGRWVILLTGAGFLGNFVLCLADHAQNGFYHPAEWTGVIAAAFAVGFLGMVLLRPADPALRVAAAVVLLAQMGVGAAGSLLHGLGNLNSPMTTYRDKFLYGSPIFAPMLFADLALLGLIGLWAMVRREADRSAGAVDASGALGRAADVDDGGGPA